ncbi:MAG TPA: carboxylating nicotinate-nucleotide diphosphorylase [Patescibacteria group bacterium]
MKEQNIQKFFQKKDQLAINNREYQKSIHALFTWLLDNDHVANDITSQKLFENAKIVTAKIITREEITVAGLEEIAYLLKTFTKISGKPQTQDGQQLAAKQTLIELTGDLKAILAFERIVLNILQRLSGIATATNQLISEIKQNKPYIAATRKTIWGDLDKKAVSVGGGLTHRLNLADGILVKDNHLLFISASEALKKLLNQVNNSLIEIEVEDKSTLLTLINIFNHQETTNVLAILLDNFYTEDVKQIMSEIKHQPNIIFEASGGITTENLSAWGATGVDLISLGALTHSTLSANLSLEIT